jgi:transposase InsO family protein
VSPPAFSFGSNRKVRRVSDQVVHPQVLVITLAADWRIDYNFSRPHSAHGWLTPVEFVEAWLNKQQLQLA